jgi:hypothetical protein
MASARIQQLLEFLQKEPDDTFLNYALALEYQKDAETIEKAQQLFETVIRNNHDYLAAYYQLGKLLELKGEISSALNILKAGQQKALEQKNRKASGEFEEAIFMLED